MCVFVLGHREQNGMTGGTWSESTHTQTHRNPQVTSQNSPWMFVCLWMSLSVCQPVSPCLSISCCFLFFMKPQVLGLRLCPSPHTPMSLKTSVLSVTGVYTNMFFFLTHSCRLVGLITTGFTDFRSHLYWATFESEVHFQACLLLWTRNKIS